MVAVVGTVPDGLPEFLGRAPNVAAVEAEGDDFDEAVAALASAERVASPYAVVPADPLAGVADEWSAMWAPGSAEHSFETAAGSLVLQWRTGRFELPDYYVVVVGEDAQENDFHLGFLKSQRPGRVVVIPVADNRGELAARVLAALAVLPQGPWWPGLDRLMEAARDYYPDAIATAAPTAPPRAAASLLS